MIRNGIGGSNTQTGLKFESNTDLKTALSTQKNITIYDREVYESGNHIGTIFQKHDLYKFFFKKYEIDWKNFVSKKLLPDEAYFCLKTNTLVIIEKKYQQVEGSVDEKLQTCHFKKRQYEKLCKHINDVSKVEYVYLFNDWFKKDSYKDVLEYIEDVSCKYYFNEIPYAMLGLSTSKEYEK